MLTLHETLLLLALHDERGTLHSRAWLGIDDALRGAVVSEWMLRGRLEVARTGLASWTTHIGPTTPILDDAHALLGLPTPSFEIAVLLDHLADRLPDLRDRVEKSLVARGALSRAVIERDILEDSEALTGRTAYETTALDRIRSALSSVPQAPRRTAQLIGLLHTIDLWPHVLPEAVQPAQEAGAWVLARDPICAAVQEDARRRAGLFEG